MQDEGLGAIDGKHPHKAGEFPERSFLVNFGSGRSSVRVCRSDLPIVECNEERGCSGRGERSSLHIELWQRRMYLRSPVPMVRRRRPALLGEIMGAAYDGRHVLSVISVSLTRQW